MPSGQYDFVVVANRLPVDQVGTDEDGSPRYETSPGGLVTAMAPVMAKAHGAWVGWPGAPGEVGEPFDADDMHLVPVPLSEDEVAEYYEGMSNGTLWPLFHDVIAAPEYHRRWWDAYVAVNRRFAEAAAEQASEGATVWVQDYQLLLVPARLRELRPDLRIGFFNHIPFPGYEIFSQLPWRRQVVEGVLGADLVGFQRRSDATNFLRACRRAADATTRGRKVHVDGPGGRREVKAQPFPISIDVRGFEELARSEAVLARAQEIRAELGRPDVVLLGVDRLDYTKGIRHRLSSFAELLEDGGLDKESTVLVQVASPSRERVRAYADLRDEVELTVGRINGDHGTVGVQPVHYLHQSFPRDEMAALYLAADVMLVTALRDGMNLVAKEYVAARHDDDGVLVLSEFAGAADELTQALLINPHDIDGTKAAIVRAARMRPEERARRMRALRRRVREHDVERWAEDFLGALEADGADPGVTAVPEALGAALRDIAGREPLLLALDFDGVCAPLVDDPSSSDMLPATRDVLLDLHGPGCQVALVSGRALADLREVSRPEPGWLLVGGHGAEPGDTDGVVLAEAEQDRLDRLVEAVDEVVAAHPGSSVEHKPTAVVLHVRRAERSTARAATEAVLAGPGRMDGVHVKQGHDVVELAVRRADKGGAVRALRERTGAAAVLYVGDDVTDEDAFRALDPDDGDVAVKVGAGDTAATHRVGTPEDVTAVLQALHGARAEAAARA